MKTTQAFVRVGVLALLGSAQPRGLLTAQILNFNSYTGLQGLPQSQVLALYQDRQSFLWIGTSGGLTRFDGTTFQTFTRRDGLRANTVTAIAKDSRGRLLVGTIKGGLCLLEPTGFRCLGLAEGLPDADVSSILAMASGEVWVGTEGGVARLALDGSVQSYTEREGLPGATVARLARDRDGTIWAATNHGLARFAGDRFEGHPSPELRDRPISVLRPTPEGLLVGFGDRLYLMREGRLEVPPGLETATHSLTDAAQDPNGHLWIASRSGVLVYRRGTALYTRENGLLDNVINTVLIDHEGTVWLGTESGLSMLTPGPFSHLTTREGLPHPFVRAVAEDSLGRLWVGTRDGIALYRDGLFHQLPLAAVPDRRVYGLAHLPGGNTLVGTRNGLIFYRDGVRRLYGERDGLPHEWVRALQADGAGGAWVGTAEGIARWTDGRLRPAGDTLVRSVYATSLARDRRGRLWIGRRADGIVILEGDRVTTLGPSQGLSGQSIWAMAEDSRGAMWVGTNGDGFYRIDSAGAVTQFTTAAGLVNDFVWQVQPDRLGGVWLFTSNGLDRFQEGRFVHYGSGDGLIDLEGSASASWEGRTGDLWFGTGSGILRYQPALGVGHSSRPVVHLEEAQAGSHLIDLSNPLIPARAGAIRIRYTSPAFRNPGSLRFRYRLDAEEWSPPIAERSLTFARLDAGHYALEVEAVNADGLSSAVPARLSFRVLPAFWQTWWFRGLALLLLGGVGAAVPWLRSRHLRRANERLERLVADHTQRLRDILEHSTNLFYAQATDRTFTYVSPNAVTFFGWDPGKVSRHADDVLTDHPENANARRLVQRAIETGEKPPTYEVEIWGPNRERRWVQVNEAPLVRDGQVVGFVGSLTDITESKEARASQEQLEAQLRQAQKMEAVGRLAGGIAHDFNNLLTAIVGHSEFAMESLGSGSQVEGDLTIIRRAADRATTLVSQLLAFSRQQMVKRQVLDLNVVVAEGARMLERVLGSDVELVLQLAPSASWVAADGNQLEQILLNLAVNARDAMPRGGRLSMSTAAQVIPEALATDVPAGRYVVLEVADSGHGMDRETQARLFEPFFTTKEVGKGTGLGLAMVYGIVKQNGGHILVESEPGCGAIFRLYFPTAAEPVPEHPAPRPDDPTADASTDRVVLVVEDEDSIRDLVGMTLTRRGYRVLRARDGQSALELSRQYGKPIDLLLTDMIMPGLNGRQVAERITADRRETRVLFMSGHAEGMLGRNGLIEDQATELLRKPFTPSELARRVEEILVG
jgi:PAS domain S-box-containing protein